MTTTIYGFFEDSRAGRKALGALLDRGAEKEDLIAIFPPETLDASSTESMVEQLTAGVTTTTPRDAAVGAAKGAGAGVVVGAVAALASLSIPGFGIVTGGHALATALIGLAGTAAGGALAGGVAGYLRDQGVPERVALDAEDALKHGHSVVGVQVPSGYIGEFEAREILSKYGARNYWHRGEPILYR